jgi:hypothetical protein
VESDGAWGAPPRLRGRLGLLIINPHHFSRHSLFAQQARGIDQQGPAHGANHGEETRPHDS